MILKKVTKSFLQGKRLAIDSLEAEIPEKKITGIVGPDGAGKTTLLRILAGLMSVDAGECYVFSHRIDTEAEKIQASLGYLPQKVGLYEDLSVAENLSLYSQIQGTSKEDPSSQKLMDFAGLRPFQNRLVGNLSGGMKQKLGLMTAMLGNPKLLLLDEPTMGVDPISQSELWKMIFELQKQGITIIVSTSYLTEAEKCDHVLLLNEGKKIFFGNPKEFQERVRGKTFYIENVGDMKRRILDDLLGKEGIIDTIAEGDRVRVTFDRTDPSKDPTDYGLSK